MNSENTCNLFCNYWSEMAALCLYVGVAFSAGIAMFNY